MDKKPRKMMNVMFLAGCCEKCQRAQSTDELISVKIR